jgi:hypothetical protein
MDSVSSANLYNESGPFRSILEMFINVPRHSRTYVLSNSQNELSSLGCYFPMVKPFSVTNKNHSTNEKLMFVNKYFPPERDFYSCCNYSLFTKDNSIVSYYTNVFSLPPNPGIELTISDSRTTDNAIHSLSPSVDEGGLSVLWSPLLEMGPTVPISSLTSQTYNIDCLCPPPREGTLSPHNPYIFTNQQQLTPPSFQPQQ